ncbi:hypothetical protein BDN67DRAFT_985868 [Paxillus ammoniavirescens]|nr:hypothetical protein BDN67DRAFT_985868 [Paxillus ammoniavirescens]
MPVNTQGSGNIVRSKSPVGLDVTLNPSMTRLESGETSRGGARVGDRTKRQRSEENPDQEQSSAQMLSRTNATSEEMVLLHQLTSDVQQIKAKIDVLIADCEAQLGLGMAYSNGKFCRPSGRQGSGSSGEDLMDGSQNLYCFWSEGSSGEIEESQNPYSLC